MKKIEIWLEATHLFKSPTKNKSGIGNYTENIIKGVIEQNKHDNYHFSIVANLFFTNKKSYISGINSKDYSYLFSRFIPSKIWNQLLKKKLMPPIETLHIKRPNLVINFDFTAVPTFKGTKTITVIHDLAFLRYPEFVETKNLSRLKKFVPDAINRSALIIAVSESTKKDIEQAYKISPNKIKVVPNAVDTKIYKRNRLSRRVKLKYKLPDNYFLHLGNIEPRKNIVGIITAYENLSSKITDKYKLVLAGGSGWNDDEIKNKLETTPARKNIVLTGYIDQKDAAELYSGAKMFLFPSFYEGFGLPILESMACGTPVITANNSSLKEVGGDAALYVDANSAEALTKKIVSLVEDKRLCESLIKKGHERASVFDWDKSSKKMLEVIEEVLKK